MRTDWRGKIHTQVWIFPFGIGHFRSEAEKMTVFESIIIVGIFIYENFMAKANFLQKDI